MKLLLPLIIFFILFLGSNYAQSTVAKPELPPNQAPDTLVPSKKVEKAAPRIFTIVEEEPYFLDTDCQMLSTRQEQKKCGEQKLMYYISRNILYPDSLKAKNIQGIVFISFVIETNGEMSSIKIMRDPSPNGELGILVLQLMNQMIEEKKLWEPGKLKGAPTAVRFNLPVRFKIH